MKLSDQVCTLDQAKKLKELGVVQGRLFSWIRADHYPFALIPVNYYDENAPDYRPYDSMGTIHEEYSAFTLAELIRMLGMYWFSTLMGGEYSIGLALDQQKGFTDFIQKENAADGMACILIHRIEKGLTAVEEINKLLQS